MPAGKTFESGHFKKHNADVLDRIQHQTDLKAAVKLYVDTAVADGKALVDAGASPEQMKSSLQALSDQFDTAWAAIVANTDHGSSHR